MRRSGVRRCTLSPQRGQRALGIWAILVRRQLQPAERPRRPSSAESSHLVGSKPSAALDALCAAGPSASTALAEAMLTLLKARDEVISSDASLAAPWHDDTLIKKVWNERLKEMSRAAMDEHDDGAVSARKRRDREHSRYKAWLFQMFGRTEHIRDVIRKGRPQDFRGCCRKLASSYLELDPWFLLSMAQGSVG